MTSHFRVVDSTVRGSHVEAMFSGIGPCASGCAFDVP